MIFIFTNLVVSLFIVMIIQGFLGLRITVPSKRIITRIEIELGYFNSCFTTRKNRIREYVENILKDSTGGKIAPEVFYILSICCAMLGGKLGYSLRFPILVLVLTITFLFIPTFLFYLYSAFQRSKSYKTTFKVLHIAEKASQFSNSPLVVFQRMIPYLCSRDRSNFEKFLISFQANQPYQSLFAELEESLANKYLKELVICARETSNGINLNQSIKLILDGYNQVFELLQKRKRTLNGMVYFLYSLCLCFIIFSVYIGRNYAFELQNQGTVGLIFKIAVLATIISIFFASAILINTNQD